jgi:hypothetical protein
MPHLRSLRFMRQLHSIPKRIDGYRLFIRPLARLAMVSSLVGGIALVLYGLNPYLFSESGMLIIGFTLIPGAFLFLIKISNHDWMQERLCITRHQLGPLGWIIIMALLESRFHSITFSLAVVFAGVAIFVSVLATTYRSATQIGSDRISKIAPN